MWLAPQLWYVGLVYLHPLVALWFLERQLRRSPPGWLPAYHACLALMAVVLLVLWWRLANAPSLVEDDQLAIRITRHAGAGGFDGGFEPSAGLDARLSGDDALQRLAAGDTRRRHAREAVAYKRDPSGQPSSWLAANGACGSDTVLTWRLSIAADLINIRARALMAGKDACAPSIRDRALLDNSFF